MKNNPTFERVDELITKEIEKGTFPGGVLLVRDKERILKHNAYGLKSEVPDQEPMKLNTIFDLASLTKVVATTTLALQLIESGVWNLTDPVSCYVDEFANQEITLKNLLTHTSGLTPWTDLFSGTTNREEALERLLTDRWPILEPVLPPTKRVIYSDLNFILLGLAIERSTKKNLTDLSRERIFLPLKMEDTGFNPSDELLERIAPTEDTPLRGIIRGQVHDENCRALGGASGHAGLFGTAKDLDNFVAFLLNGGKFKGERILGTATVGLLGRNFTKNVEGGRRTLGWQLQSDNTDSAGDLLSPESFGHTGFTGGSIWIDRSRNVGTVFLSNRVHPDRSRGKDLIGDFRARLHNAIIGQIQE